MKRTLLFIFKTIVAAALLFWLLHAGVIDLSSIRKLANHPLMMTVAVLTPLFSLIAASARWWLLLRCQGVILPFLRVFHIFMVSNLTISFLPGGASGDVVKSILIARSQPLNKTPVVLTVLNDRLFAVGSLVLFACFFAVPLIYRHEGSLRTLAVSVFTLLAILVVSLLFVLVAAPRLKSRSFLISDSFLSRTLSHLHDFVLSVRQNIGLTILAFLYSIVSSSAMFCGIAAIGLSFSYEGLGFADYAFAGALAMVANALPLTPGGLGIGEAAFNTICHWLTTQPNSIHDYGTTFLVYRAFAVLFSLYGIVPMLVPKLTLSKIAVN